ncbi:MAG: glycosyltransferase [Caldilineaceae bacterium]
MPTIVQTSGDIVVKRPLTIAFFVEGMYASGVDTSTQLLAEALRAQGHRVIVFLPWKEHCAAGSKNTVLLPAVRVNSKQGVYLSYPLSLKLINVFKHYRFDLIHVHTSTSVNLLAWQMSALFDLPLVYTYHTMTKEYVHYWAHIPDALGGLLDPLVDSAVEKFDQLICNKAAAVITPSAKAARYLESIEVTPPVSIIPNGVNLEHFYPWPADYLHQQWRVPTTAQVLLWVGRLNQEKRPLLAYEIFRAICPAHPDLWLVMAGEGPLRQELETQIRQDGLTKRVILTGLVNHQQMPALYNSADLWISTSQSEVHPMVALEAMACGLPAIAWRDSALTGVIEEGVNGFQVDATSAFSAKLTQILDDGDLYQQLHRGAMRKRCAYSIEATATAIADLYTSILRPRQPAQRLWQVDIRQRLLKTP